MKKLRLLKVIVQPIVLIDDGETLTEAQVPSFTVAPAAWPTFAATEFAAAFAEWQREIEQEPA